MSAVCASFLVMLKYPLYNAFQLSQKIFSIAVLVLGWASQISQDAQASKEVGAAFSAKIVHMIQFSAQPNVRFCGPDKTSWVAVASPILNLTATVDLPRLVSSCSLIPVTFKNTRTTSTWSMHEQ